MTRRAAATTACAGLLAIIVASAAPAADACFEITRMLQNKTFVAKQPLYDTKIQNDGIIDLERDKEEIPLGAEFTVLRVVCDSKKIEVKIRQISPVKLDAVEVRFLLSEAERYMPNAVNEFKKMMGYVFETPQH
jgi:hypothetical protein